MRVLQQDLATAEAECRAENSGRGLRQTKPYHTIGSLNPGQPLYYFKDGSLPILHHLARRVCPRGSILRLGSGGHLVQSDLRDDREVQWDLRDAREFPGDPV